MNCILSVPICRYNMNNFSQFQTCWLLQFFFLHGKWSSSILCSIFYICCTNLSIRFFSPVSYIWCFNLSHLQASLYHLAPSLCKWLFYHIYFSAVSRIDNKQKLSFLTEYIYVFICICISMYITIFDRCIITHNLRLGSYVIHNQ